MKKFLLFVVTAWTLTACGEGDGKDSTRGDGVPSRSDFYVTLDWYEGPVADEENYSAARLTFQMNDGAVPETVEGVQFEPRMPEMGHGANLRNMRITAAEGAPNIFLVDGVFFTMPGTWVIDVTARVNGKLGKVDSSVYVPE